MHNKIAYKKACILYLSYVVHCIALSSYSYHTKTPTPNHHKQQLTRKRTSKTYCYACCCCCWGCVFVKKDNNECTACTLVMYYVMVVGRECVLENKNQEEKFLLVFLLLH